MNAMDLAKRGDIMAAVEQYVEEVEYGTPSTQMVAQSTLLEVIATALAPTPPAVLVPVETLQRWRSTLVQVIDTTRGWNQPRLQEVLREIKSLVADYPPPWEHAAESHKEERSHDQKPEDSNHR